MWTLPGRLEFIIINPTPQNKAHITISYKNIDDLQLLNGQYQTLGYSYAPQPQSPEGTKIILGYYDKSLRLRKYGKIRSLQHGIFFSGFYRDYLSNFNME